MKIAYLTARGPGASDALFHDVAMTLKARGWRLAGAVQVNTDRGPDAPCDMDVLVLPDGPMVRISQSLGPGSRGCRLDVPALEQAVGLAKAQVAEGVDLMIINKFGKHEADGRGFRELIGEAAAAGIPVIVGLNETNRPAFEAFTGGAAEALPADRQAILDWVEAARREAAA